MKIALGSDEKTSLTDYMVQELRTQGHEVISFGALEEGQKTDWPLVSQAVGRAVASGQADEGILFCWTGTGASIAANKIPGVRAALCGDAKTAEGARQWNHANVLVLSLRTTTEALAREILESWFSTPWSQDAWNLKQMNVLKGLDAGR
jgi:ribose 5-phosphate isomerase B